MRENDKISDKENICICSVSTPTKDENKAHKVTSSCLADLKKDSRCISCNEQPVNKKHSSFFGEIQSKHQKPRTVVPTSEPCECRNSYLGGEPCFSKKFRSSIHDGMFNQISIKLSNFLNFDFHIYSVINISFVKLALNRL